MTQDNTNFGRDQFIINQPGTVNLGDSQRSRALIYGGIDPIPPALAKRIDRTQPQAQLRQWIEGRSPLVGIVGGSGFGKTVLAAWSLQVLGQGFEVARWVNCQSASSFGVWAGWVLQELGFLVQNPLWTDQDFALELVRRLRDRSCLLVLDRLEVLIDAPDWQSFVDFLQDWQRRGQGSTIVLTTQQERGLTAQWLRLAGVEPGEGCGLLEQKGIVDEGQGWRSQLSEAAAGHPLLLNLAATWLRQEKPQAMISAEDLDFFRGLFLRYQGNPEAQVEEVFGDLWGRLPENWRLGLMDVSVYRIAFDGAMAAAMGLVVEGLAALVEQGFLTVQAEDGRWRLHPLMARMVAAAAQENGRVAAAHERAIAFYDGNRRQWTGDVEDCRSQFESFYHCCALGRYGDAYQVMDSCVRVLYRQGHWRSLVPIYEQLTAAWQPGDEAETRNLGWAWTRLGNTYRSLGRYEEAIAAHEKAQQYFQAIAFRQGEAASLGSLGNAYKSLGQYPRAIEFHQQHYDIAREIGNRQGEAASLGNLGNAYDSLGQYPRAIEFHQQSLDIKREIGDRNGEANSLFNMAYALAKLDRRWEARQHYEQAQQIYEALQLDHRIEQCKTALYNLGQIIPTQVIRAPQIGDESDSPRRSRQRWQMPWWGWVLVGVAIVLAIALSSTGWWLKG